MRFDHAGIATTSVTALAEQYETLLDAQIVHEETFDGMCVVFLEFDDSNSNSDSDSYFELLEPLGYDDAGDGDGGSRDGDDGESDAESNGPIASYLDRNGPGIHHLALATDDIEAALDRARELDIKLIDDEPRDGAWGHDVAFLHPESTGGILLEYVQH